MENHEIIDLTDTCATFPEPPSSPIIPIDSKIRELQRKFSPINQNIVLVGPSGSGKTNHLMQFAKQNCSSVFCYFLSNNYWTWRQSSFLLSLCKQMKAALGLNSNINGEYLEEVNVDTEQLKLTFGYLNQRVVDDLVKRKKQTCYFVVDGLEWACQGNQGERIIDLLPPFTYPRGLYFLGSMNRTPGCQISFNYLEDEPQYFSLVETEKYLSDIPAAPSEIKKMQDISGGMPGILYLAKKLYYEAKTPITDIISKSDQFDSLVEFQWKKSLLEFSDDKKRVLALLAFSLVPLKGAIIADLLNITEEDITKIVSETGIIYRTTDNSYYFNPELHKTYAKSKLDQLKQSSISLLSNYYENHPNDRASKHLLPEYYRIAEDFNALQDLLVPNYITKVILENKNFNLAQRDLRSAIELASKTQDINIIKYGLTISQVKTLSDELIGSSEIYALIALNKYDQALELAYATKLTSTRIRLLAAIYSAMEKEGINVSRQSLNELEKMINGLNIDEIEPDDLITIASDLFPLLPDIATTLVEKAKYKESEQNPLELFVLMTSGKSDGPESEDLITKIDNREVQEFALVHSPWLSRLSANQVIKKAEQIKNVKAKVYLYQQWCLRNRKNHEVNLVMEAALDAINHADYKISLRSLRQLSEPIKRVGRVRTGYATDYA